MQKASSQWEFDELFNDSNFKKTYSVSDLSREIKQSLKGFGRIRVAGEISNFKIQTSGHCYFGIKDASAQISCVLFRSKKIPNRSRLDNGAKVILEGNLNLYETRGQCQIVVHQIELQGIGELQEAFENLKKRLQQEGLFDASRKRELPSFCFHLGVITSSNGAAWRDVCKVIERRNPAMNLILLPVRVQGQGAANEIAEAIEKLNRYSQKAPHQSQIQAILLARGGGSLEDLWAFNEEILARAIADSKLPIISAIGHEIDFTISDFVADLRAPTPSAAAEIITEGVFSTRLKVLSSAAQMHIILTRLIRHWTRLSEQMHRRLERAHPSFFLNRKREILERSYSLICDRIQLCKNQKYDHIKHLSKMIHLLSPISVLERGYSITKDAKTGEIIKDASDVKTGNHLSNTLYKGEIISEVIEVQHDQKDMKDI